MLEVFTAQLQEPVAHQRDATCQSMHLDPHVQVPITSATVVASSARAIHLRVRADVASGVTELEEAVRARVQDRRLHSCIAPGSVMKLRVGPDHAIDGADELRRGHVVDVAGEVHGAWVDASWCGLVLTATRSTVVGEEPNSDDDMATRSAMPAPFRPRLPDLHPDTEEDDDALTDDGDGEFRTEVCLRRLTQSLTQM
jgi:hypothetical protein